MSGTHGSSCGPGEHVTGYATNTGTIYAAKHFDDGDVWHTEFEPGDPRLPEFTVAAALDYARVNFI